MQPDYWSAWQVLARLRARGVWGRPLGNVVYFMISPVAQPGEADRMLDALVEELRLLDREAGGGEAGGGGGGGRGAAEASEGQARYQPVP